jgi:sirohydrochlorin ferrochelatase
MLGAAGSSDARAVEDCRIAAAKLSRALDRPVTVGFISAAAPRLADAVRDARSGSGSGAGSRVVIASYLLAPGYFAGLTSAADADLVTAPLLVADGTVPAEIVEVILDRYRAACNADVSSPLHSG